MQHYYLLGSPVNHSLSPAMMNRSFALLGIDATYGLCETDETRLETVVQSLRSEGASGWNCTMPVKSAMASLCDELSTASRIGGAVNTVVNRGGRLFGDTTDGTGFLRAMEEAGCPLPGKKMTLLGTGGAASAILIQAALSGVREISVFANRPASHKKAETIAEKLRPHTETVITLHSYRDPEELRAEINTSAALVNATSVGMEGGRGEGKSLIPDSTFLRPPLFVYDIIYHPCETPLLGLASSAGCPHANGESMLLYQGAASFFLWTGQEMPVRDIYTHIFRAEK